MATRWIRAFGFNNYPANMGLPESGRFLGTIDFDAIQALYPSRTDKGFLNIRVPWFRDDGGAWLSVLIADVHAIEPTLAATFPLPDGDQ